MATKLIRVLVSEASRKDAHNTDDLYIRWELRRTRHKYEQLDMIIRELPEFRNSMEAKAYKNYLVQQREYLNEAKRELQEDMHEYGKDYKRLYTHLIDLDRETALMIRQINYGRKVFEQWKYRDEFDDIQQRTIKNLIQLTDLADFEVEYTTHENLRTFNFKLDNEVILSVEAKLAK